MNALSLAKRQILFIGIVSILLKAFYILVLIHHIDLALVDNWNDCLGLCHPHLFVTYLALHWQRFGFQLFQLRTTVLATLVARLLGHVNQLLLNYVRLFVFVL